MTEQEWLTSCDPAAMLKWGMNVGIGREELDRFYARKLRLFVVACCRQVWHLLTDERSRHAVEVAEQFADGQSTKKELRETRLETRLRVFGALTSSDGSFGLNDFIALHVCDPRIETIGTRFWNGYIPPTIQANLLRDIVGNPQRSVELSGEVRVQHPVWGLGIHHPWLLWNDGVILKIAQSIYEERSFERMPILGDALEEAGCTNEDVLQHCRPSPDNEPWEHRDRANNDVATLEAEMHARLYTPRHVRGCWVIDLLLGKK